MTSLLAVGYETRLGYDSHLSSSQIRREALGLLLPYRPGIASDLGLLIKVNRCLLKQLLLVFLNHYEECHISRSLSSLADIEAVGACPKRGTGDRV